LFKLGLKPRIDGCSLLPRLLAGLIAGASARRRR
jgi:hypothetical protein